MRLDKDKAVKDFLVDSIIGLVLGVATFFAARNLGQQTADIAGLISIITFLVASAFAFCVRSHMVIREKMTETEIAHDGLLRAIRDYSASRKFGLMRVIDSLNLQIEADRVPEVWRQLLWDVEEEYLATNYIRDIYATAWADAALAVQAAKIKEKLIVRKVFIIDDKQELRDCLDLFHEQDSAGIDAKYIYKNDISLDLQAAGKTAKLGGQFDFGIFDKKFVLRWNLAPKKRTVESGSIVTISTSVEEFREIFEALYGAAKPLPPRLDVRPLNEKERAEIYEWPHYSAPYEEFNYAIEREVGWLDKQGRNTGALALGGFRENKLEAFSLLVPSGRGSVEFYVAVRATRVHKGLGREMTRRTIRYAFKNCGVDRIWLKVRKNHPFGRRLYEESGFVLCGTKREEVMGKQVEFDVMELVNRSS